MKLVLRSKSIVLESKVDRKELKCSSGKPQFSKLKESAPDHSFRGKVKGLKGKIGLGCHHK